MRYKSLLFAVICTAVLCAAEQHAGEKFVMHLSENWEISGDLPTHALLISLQGVANIGEPRLYFQYPPKWDYNFSDPLLEYYRSSRKMQFQELGSADEALKALGRYARGFVVWDKGVRTSLIVAFTAAGIHRAVVVSEDLIPMAEKYGLSMIEDLRGKFTGQSDIAIYEWAYKRYWAQCSRENTSSTWEGNRGM